MPEDAFALVLQAAVLTADAEVTVFDDVVADDTDADVGTADTLFLELLFPDELPELPDVLLAVTLTSCTVPSKSAVILFVVESSDSSCIYSASSFRPDTNLRYSELSPVSARYSSLSPALTV